MNENINEQNLHIAPHETNLPETLGPSTHEPTEIPAELRQNFSEPDEPQAEQVLETYEQPIPERPKPKLKKDEYKNMANMRMQLEQAQKERDQALRKLQERNEGQLGDDDIAEGRHLNRVQQEIKALKEELVQARIKAQYHDFDAVVTMDNLASLRENYPELAASLQSTSDLYTQAASAYTLIKKLGLAQDQETLSNRAKVQNNIAKPRPAASLNAQQGDSPLTKANAFSEGLSEDLKKQLLKEMKMARLNY